jgi:tight adherence protein B
MTTEQILMALIIVGVGGSFLLGFLLVRRLRDARQLRLQGSTSTGDSGINLGGDSGVRLLSAGRKHNGDSGIGVGDSGFKTSDAGPKGSSGSSIGIGDSGTHMSGSGARVGRESAQRTQPVGSGRGVTTAYRAGVETGLPLTDDPILNPPKGLADRLDRGFNRMVDRTGMAWSPEQALGVICLVGVLVAGGLYLWKQQLWVSMVGLVLGVALPLAVLVYLQARWQKQIQELMPDAFFFMARSLRAGLSLEQALNISGTQGAEPLAGELRRCSERIRLGLPIATALELAGRRINLLDFNVFVSVVSLHQTTGGNLALQLDRLAASVRDRNQYQGYFRSATALGRISAIAIGGAVPVIFLGYALFQPEYALRFFESAAGIVMLATAFGLEIVGVIWLYMLLKINY